MLDSIDNKSMRMRFRRLNGDKTKEFIDEHPLVTMCVYTCIEDSVVAEVSCETESDLHQFIADLTKELS